MAFKLSPDAQAVFFDKVFGADSPVAKRVQTLLAHGVEFETALYTIKATFEGKTFQVPLTYGSSSLMKGTVPTAMADLNKLTIEHWVTSLPWLPVEGAPTVVVDTADVTWPVVAKPTILYVFGAPPTVNLLVLIKTIRVLTGLSLKEAKDIADTLKAGEGYNLLLPPDVIPVSAVAQLHAIGVESSQKESDVALKFNVKPVAKPIPSVIHLREAKAVSQKVHGTNNGSVYYCVALNDRVKVAARNKSGTVSIRVEWTDTILPEELALLTAKDSGLSVKGGYASLHVTSEGVPYGRIIGAFVTGLGITWTQVITNAKELVVD